MPSLTVHSGELTRRLSFVPGSSLRDILNTGELRVRSACRGIGACALCRVRIDAGPELPLSEAERLHRESGTLAADARLACQLFPTADLEVTLLNPAGLSAWHSPPQADWQSDFPLDPAYRHGDFGVAVDLGTTHISVALFDFGTGRRIACRRGRNPQGRYSADILNRLVAASESPEQAADLQRIVKEAIADALSDISLREGVALARVRRLAVVGNTAMLCLLAGSGYRELLEPANWTAPVVCPSLDTDVWAAAWDMSPGTVIELIPPLGGFVGSDLLAGLVHTRISEGSGPALFIDFGTNSEMALWNGERLWVTSAAGGPAFEGSGLSCGMPAEAGAICRVVSGQEGWRYEVEGEVEPQGLCGSALVDVLALLLADGRVTELGRFDEELSGNRFLLPGQQRFSVTKGDIDLLQRAKAAIGVGVEVLCREAGVAIDGIATILIGGAFGRYLDPVAAIAIGLLPDVPPERVELRGNTALDGCQDLVASVGARQLFEQIHAKSTLINLSTVAEFEELFLDHLYIRRFPKPAPAAQPDPERLSGRFCFDAFLRASQYFARLLPTADVLRESIEVALKIFRADFACFPPSADGRGDREWGEALRCCPALRGFEETVEQVIDYGFLALETVTTEPPIQLGFFPVSRGSATVTAMIVGYREPERLPKDLLDAYLALAGLAGAALERQATLSALAESEEKFRQISNSAQDAIIMIDDQDLIVYWNPAAEHILGYSAQEALGRDLHRLIVPERFRQAFLAGFGPYLKSGAGPVVGRTLEVAGLRKDGTEFPAELSIATAVFGSRRHTIGILRDISERKHAEEALRALNAGLEQRVAEEVANNRQKDLMLIQQSRLATMGEMMHNVAHQWRQPLNALTLILQNIKDDFEFGQLNEESLRKQVAEGHRVAQKMSATIDDFRDFYRTDRARVRFDLADAVREALHLVEASFRHYGIGVTVEAPRAVYVEGYPSEYSQVLLNVLVNAKDAIIASGADGKVHISVEQDGDKGIVRVRDNGGGIPEEVLPKIFDPYFTTRESGTGIGLYMSRMIMERMPGSIKALNVEGGAEMTLVTPIANA